jgi:ketosteroid isomerase-like protein
MEAVVPSPPAVRAASVFSAAAVLALAPAPGAAQTSEPGRVAAGQTTIFLPDTAAYSPAQRRILAMERERSVAIARRDTTWLAALYAPDFRGVVGTGARVDRPALFRVFGQDTPDQRFVIDELEVREFGAAATVTGRLRLMTPEGQTVTEQRYLHVYVRRSDRWWLVAAQGTAVAPRPAPPPSSPPNPSPTGVPRRP